MATGGLFAMVGGYTLLAETGKGDKPGCLAKLVRVGGVLKIDINGQIFEPLAFRSFRPEERNIREFYAAGVRLMSPLHTGLNCTLDVPYSKFGELWLGPGQYDFSVIDRQMELFLKHAPEAYFNVMLQLDTRPWGLKAHPDWSNCYWNLVEMAGHEPWRENTARFLQDMLRYVEGKYGDRVFAYSLFCGSSTEWYTNSQGRGRPEAAIREHPIKTACFRKFTGDPTATMPPLEVLHHTSNGVLRDPVVDAAALRYWRFHHEIIGNAILYFAGKSQEVLRHRKLLGLFYGYLTQLNSERLLQEGHLAYERVWSCPDIDMIFAPAKYGQPRSFEGASGFLTTVDSLDLHGKLTFHECDHTTSIAPTTVENGRSIPGSGSKMKDAFQTRMVLRREFAMAKAKRVALWWFDFFGGYYYAEALMKEVANLVKVERRLRNVPMRSVAEIAVFGDVPSMYYINARSNIADDLLVQPPDELARIGAPYDIYNFSDLDHKNVPWERYKLCIFLNTFAVPEEKQAFIRSKVQRDGRTLMWIYAPNYIQKDGFSVDAISDITGIKVVRRVEEGSAVTVRTEGLFARIGSAIHFGFTPGEKPDSQRDQTFDMRSRGRIETSPLFEVRDEAAQTYGVYDSNGATALALKKSGSHTSIYSAVGNLPAALYREIARAAGVHIYYEGSDPTYINSRLFGIHMQSDTACEVALPSRNPCRIEELFDGGDILGENGKLTFTRQPGSTKLYLITGVEYATGKKG